MTGFILGKYLFLITRFKHGFGFQYRTEQDEQIIVRGFFLGSLVVFVASLKKGVA